MYRKLSQSEGNALGYHIAGTLTHPEVKEIHREVEQALERHGSVRLLVEFGELSMPEPRAALEDLKLTPEYLTDVERFAVVGEAAWQGWLARFTDIVARGEARHFEPEALVDAWRWLKDA
jgi:hypothetical protein